MQNTQFYLIGIYSAFVRIKIEYRNLKLGYLWEGLSLLFIVGFLTTVWGRVLDSSSVMEYFWYVLTGFSVWGLMSRCVDQSLSFRNRLIAEVNRGGSSIEGEVLADITYCFLQFFLSFPIILLAALILKGVTLIGLFTLLFSLVCIFLTAIGLSNSLGILTIFFEDISRLMRMVMRVAFLMTPILWMPKMLGDGLENWIYLNPFYSFLDVFRSGILGQSISELSIIVMLCTTFFTSLVGTWVLKTHHHRVLAYLHFKK